MAVGDPRFYVYEADTHCPDCALERFGSDGGHGHYGRGWVPEGVEDGEGNPVSAGFEGADEAGGDIVCGTCQEIIDRAERDDDQDQDEDDDWNVEEAE